MSTNDELLERLLDRAAAARQPEKRESGIGALVSTLLWLTIAATITITVILVGTERLYGVHLPTFLQSVREYNEAEATATATAPRPTAAPPALGTAGQRREQNDDGSVTVFNTYGPSGDEQPPAPAPPPTTAPEPAQPTPEPPLPTAGPSPVPFQWLMPSPTVAPAGPVWTDAGLVTVFDATPVPQEAAPAAGPCAGPEPSILCRNHPANAPTEVPAGEAAERAREIFGVGQP